MDGLGKCMVLGLLLVWATACCTINFSVSFLWWVCCEHYSTHTYLWVCCEHYSTHTYLWACGGEQIEEKQSKGAKKVASLPRGGGGGGGGGGDGRIR